MHAHTVYLGFGANMGDREGTFRKALLLLQERVGRILRTSPVYTSAALNPSELQDTGQPDFLNACLSIETTLSPSHLLDAVLEIERELGRNRDHGLHWGPRTIDIDILLYGRKVIHTERLKVPHPYLAERDFVLVPLADIAPDVFHPVSGNTITDLLIDLTERKLPAFVTGVFAPDLLEFAELHDLST